MHPGIIAPKCLQRDIVALFYLTLQNRMRVSSLPGELGFHCRGFFRGDKILVPATGLVLLHRDAALALFVG